MNGAPRNAERLSRPDVDGVSVDGPGQHARDAVDGLFVMVVAVRGSHQALRGRDHKLKGRDAAARVVSGEQETNGERPERMVSSAGLTRRSVAVVALRTLL